MSSVQWQPQTVKSPHLSDVVPVIAARKIPYIAHANRFQNLTVYLPDTHQTRALEGQPVTSLFGAENSTHSGPRYQVHIHGGAWRDPNLTSDSIEAAVAHAFSNPTASSLTAIISINYTLTHFPGHPTSPYHTILNNRSDPARDGRHPDHIRDVLYAFALLRSLGLSDDSYILSGHSAGACLAFQASLIAPQYWASQFPQDWDGTLLSPPRPAALLGMNGLYDLQALVHGLGPSHAHLGSVYAEFQTYTFGPDEGGKWAAASPAHFDTNAMALHLLEGQAPKLVVLGQSTQDQLVPMNERQRMALQLEQVDGIKVLISERCTGVHAAPWEQGYMIWESILDVLGSLKTTT